MFSALDAGCVSIEADVWLRESDLYVGHDKSSLTDTRTLRSLYVDPLVKLLERRNVGRRHSLPDGIFEANPAQTLVLLIDIKSSPSETWDEVLRQLQPLREHDWLSYVSEGTLHNRPITVVGTGNTDFAQLVQNTTYRDHFFDAPIDRLQDSEYNSFNSYYASESFSKTIGRVWFGDTSQGQLRKVRAQVTEAHNRGLKVRYWDLPSWPSSVRTYIWDVLVREGVDMINVDDVDAARREWRNRGWPTLLHGG